MRNAATRNRIGQCAHHMVLPDDVGEGLRPPLAGDNLVGGGQARLKGERRKSHDAKRELRFATDFPTAPASRTNSVESKKVARHSTALRERRYRCYLPVLAEFTRLLMHGTWPRRTVRRFARRATPISCRQQQAWRPGRAEFWSASPTPQAAPPWRESGRLWSPVRSRPVHPPCPTDAAPVPRTGAGE